MNQNLTVLPRKLLVLVISRLQSLGKKLKIELEEGTRKRRVVFKQNPKCQNLIFKT